MIASLEWLKAKWICLLPLRLQELMTLFLNDTLHHQHGIKCVSTAESLSRSSSPAPNSGIPLLAYFIPDPSAVVRVCDAVKADNKPTCTLHTTSTPRRCESNRKAGLQFPR